MSNILGKKSLSCSSDFFKIVITSLNVVNFVLFRKHKQLNWVNLEKTSPVNKNQMSKAEFL